MAGETEKEKREKDEKEEEKEDKKGKIQEKMYWCLVVAGGTGGKIMTALTVRKE